MKNIIDRFFFKTILEKSKVLPIESHDVQEFQQGKNFFYQLKKKSYIRLHAELNKILEKIELNNSSVAFRKNTSYLNLFEPHRKNYYFLRLDIRSFFHSIQIKDIKKIFQPYMEGDIWFMKYNNYYDYDGELVVDGFINLVTYQVPKNSKNIKFQGKKILPMGFKTSPIISNIIFRQLDIQIQKLCESHEIVYTRYADDMLFSSSKKSAFIHSETFTKEIRIIIGQMNFKLNEHKTLKAKHTLSLNGYTIQYENNFKIMNNQTKTREFYGVVKDLNSQKIETRIINEFRLSNKKINIIKKIIYMINIEKKSSDLIMKKLYNINYKKEKNSEKKNYEQLLYKILGYRSYLLSIVQFDKKYHCTQKETIEKYIKIINDLEKIAEKYQKEIDKLEKIIEKKRKSLKNMSKILIGNLPLIDSQKKNLKKANFKTLKDFYELTEKDLIDKVKGVGEVNAKNIMEVIRKELKKYRK